jgi:hypothetical protein
VGWCRAKPTWCPYSVPRCSIGTGNLRSRRDRQTLCEEAKEPFDEKLTKAEASQHIDELQARTGRGKQRRDNAHA